MRGNPNIEKNLLRREKGLLLTLITCVILWFFIDTCLYIYLKILQRTHNPFYEIKIPTDDQLDGFYKKYFHAKWGWDIPKGKKGAMGNRISHNYRTKKGYKIKVFGDSFTYGTGLDDHETFSYIVEERTGWECLNYGVGGYGTDQALLKYKDNHIKTKYTILAILDENIGRCMTIWRGFYNIRGFSGTKPRFEITERGITLIANPVKNYDDLMMFKNIKFINFLKKHDYWYQYYKGLNAPPVLKWPASATIFPHIDFFIRNLRVLIKSYLLPTYETETSLSKFYHLYARDSEGLRIMLYIIKEFIDFSRLKGEIPIILIFPMRHSIDIIKKFSKKPYQHIIDYLNDNRSNFIDFGDIFIKEKYNEYYQGGYGHFSVKGNERVAAELINYIQGLE